MGTQQFCLKWNNYHSNLSTEFKHLLSNSSYVDVTLACEGQSLKAHKVLLSACSPFFHELFINNPCQHPIVILKDISFLDMKSILTYIYHGEVNVSNEKLSSFLKTAHILRVKGLDSMNDNNEDISETHDDQLDLNTYKDSMSDKPPKHKKRKRRNSSGNFTKALEKDIKAKKTLEEPNLESENSNPYHSTQQNSNSSHIDHHSHSTSFQHSDETLEEHPQDYSPGSPTNDMIDNDDEDDDDDDDCIFEQEMKPVIPIHPSNDLPIITEPAPSTSYSSGNELAMASTSYTSGNDLVLASTSYTSGNESMECPSYETGNELFESSTSFSNASSSRRYDCVYCGKQFHYNWHLARHINCVHSKEIQYKCPECSKIYFRKDYFNNHMKRFHQIIVL